MPTPVTSRCLKNEWTIQHNYSSLSIWSCSQVEVDTAGKHITLSVSFPGDYNKMASLNDVVKIHQSLVKEWSSKSRNLQKCEDLLTKAKVSGMDMHNAAMHVVRGSVPPSNEYPLYFS